MIELTCFKCSRIHPVREEAPANLICLGCSSERFISKIPLLLQSPAMPQRDIQPDKMFDARGRQGLLGTIWSVYKREVPKPVKVPEPAPPKPIVPIIPTIPVIPTDTLTEPKPTRRKRKPKEPKPDTRRRRS